MTDPFDLQRFVDAQADSYATALAEIRNGAKRSHWMWFIFPQLGGLGQSTMATHYGIRNMAEAQAYLDHPLLGPRLCAGVLALQDLPNPNATAVFGPIDALKLRSSLTLFAAASGAALFAAALERWFQGPDPRTQALLADQD